jgi:hypothetical protein
MPGIRSSFGFKVAMVIIAVVAAFVLLLVSGVLCLWDGGVHGYWQVWTCSDGCNTCSCNSRTLMLCPGQWKPYVPRCGVDTDQCASDADCCHGYRCVASDEMAGRCVAIKESPVTR